jgi:hypothetical protein
MTLALDFSTLSLGELCAKYFAPGKNPGKWWSDSEPRRHLLCVLAKGRQLRMFDHVKVATELCPPKRPFGQEALRTSGSSPTLGGGAAHAPQSNDRLLHKRPKPLSFAHEQSAAQVPFPLRR